MLHFMDVFVGIRCENLFIKQIFFNKSTIVKVPPRKDILSYLSSHCERCFQNVYDATINYLFALHVGSLNCYIFMTTWLRPLLIKIATHVERITLTSCFTFELLSIKSHVKESLFIHILLFLRLEEYHIFF